MAYCGNCGIELPPDSNDCPNCGASCDCGQPTEEYVTTPQVIQTAQQYQSQSQPQTQPQQPTVIYVQAPPQQPVYVQTSGKSKGLALVLCFFLGYLGIHQFYLGNPIRGILYLIFSWTCIPGIIAIFDFFLLICMSEAYFHAKYDKR